MSNSGGCYSIPNLRCSGYPCKTNLPSNVAFRGFGKPQAVFFAENIIGHVSDYLNMPRKQIQEINLQKAGEMLLLGGQRLQDDNLMRCWQECINNSNFNERTKSVAEFNKYALYFLI